jgi:2-iminobutanoate/2-iminopropanoate deaminase
MAVARIANAEARIQLQSTGADMDFFHQPEPGSPRPFSRAVRAGGMVWVSGHTAPHEPERGIHRGATPAEEVRNALGFIAGLLAEAGSSLERVVQVTMLISNREDYAACNAEYVKHFPGGLPARHTVLFGVPSEARVGFACVALVG